MARMPGAEWCPIDVNYTRGGQVEVRGVVLHIMAGTLAGTDAWFRNERAQASSHFGTGRAGALRQWVDTRDKAWTQAAGNPHWISIENEGHGGDMLTDEQLDRCAQVLAWAHKVHRVPLQIATSPSGRGLGHHAMGGPAWGKHLSCPGPRIVAQKAEIIQRAKAIVAGKPAEPKEDLIKIVLEDGIPKWPGRTLRVTSPMMRGADVRLWQEKLARRGWTIDVDGIYGPQSLAVCRGYQRATGLKATGQVDEQTWDMTWSWRPPATGEPEPGQIDETN
ncbi:N-acetylmuramoyl-L-alanine amidase [Microtetraspora sp. AC03309]|uniref:peptidoglycan recognition protein family protein n=1 Tax=Microtetraspora sp. AC03309 TaxID=2779376 RepID=UPI001E486465|nr:peptidoglycan-binding domain-containing protein [Microtetraspora sp. AC03309]MCC5580571.1 N-acetylmuramoyl-L-alanine amidase [Microtetraspora sp. AC03309]